MHEIQCTPELHVQTKCAPELLVHFHGANPIVITSSLCACVHILASDMGMFALLTHSDLIHGQLRFL